MKPWNSIVSTTLLVACFGAASMATAATIGPAGQTFNTPGGTITVKSPSTLQIPLTCDINFSGVVNTNGTVTINGVSLGGSGNSALCTFPHMKNLPAPGWVLTATSATAGTVSNVGFTIDLGVDTDCGPSSINVAWDGSKLTATNQVLSGSCTVTNLSATPDHTITVTP
ncbi:alkane oxidation protein activator PraB [Pseudomonas sp. 18175]|uniref:alkane oxidation protein activator PraB n=1 Tax=Pseudomonas sp. 18175 TaxID=3390056 RepID=UPI003D1A5421